MVKCDVRFYYYFNTFCMYIVISLNLLSVDLVRELSLERWGRNFIFLKRILQKDHYGPYLG